MSTEGTNIHLTLDRDADGFTASMSSSPLKGIAHYASDPEPACAVRMALDSMRKCAAATAAPTHVCLTPTALAEIAQAAGSEPVPVATLVLESCEEGGFTVHVPEVPGVVSEGDDVAAAILNAYDALLEMSAHLRQPMPSLVRVKVDHFQEFVESFAFGAPK